MYRKRISLFKFVSILVVIVMGLTVCVPATSHAATGREVGVATSTTLLWASSEELDARLKDIRALGANWIRVDFNWPDIQPKGSHDFRWRNYDRIVEAAKRNKLKILATLVHSPSWARNARCAKIVHSEEAERKCSPRNTDEFANFAKAAVQRYDRKSVYVWEIWNEPNLTGHWKTARANNSIYVDPEAYARVANEAAAEIKRYQPGSFVITGGLAPVYERNYPLGMRQADYMAKMLPKLNKRLFNAVAIHPYTWPHMPGIAKDYNAFYTVDNGQSDYNIRTVMKQAGWGNKQIWATEFGASTKGKRLETGAQIDPHERPDHVSEPKQARILQEGLTLWHKKQNVGPIFIHSDSDRWLMSRGNENGYGLRRKDGSKKPAYDALQKSVNKMQAGGYKPTYPHQ